MGAKEWLLLLSLGTLWGGSYLFAKLGVAELPPLTVAMARVGFAALALGAVCVLLGLRAPDRPRIWFELLGMSLLNNVVPFSLIFWSQLYISPGLAAILNATTPMFSVLLAPLLGREERLTAPRVVGVLVGIAGVTVVTAPSVATDIDGQMLAQLACIGAALSYALAGIYGRRFVGDPPLVTATGQLVASTIVLVPVVAIVDQPWTLSPSAVTVGALLGLALLSTAVAYVIYFRLLATAGATNLLLVTLLIPVSATILGVSILGEALESRHVAGMLVIAIGLAIIDGRAVAVFRSKLTTWSEHRIAKKSARP